MKHPRYEDYPPDITALSERVLLTVWPALADYQGELVLLGGLVPRYLCRPRPPALPAVTMDVDLGIALGASAGQYGSLSSRLLGLGFKRENERFVKRVNDRVDLFLDFLTEMPGKTSGTAMVDDVAVSAFRGIDRALAANREREIAGTDLYGAQQRCRVRVCEAGPFRRMPLSHQEDMALNRPRILNPKSLFTRSRRSLPCSRSPRAQFTLSFPADS